MIIPRLEQFSRYMHRNFHTEVPDSPFNDGKVEVMESSASVVLVPDGDGLCIKVKGVHVFPGRWVRFLPNKATYGYITADETWIGSGPFSGCRIEVGKDVTGRKYLAHVSASAGEDKPRQAWLDAHAAGDIFHKSTACLRGKVDKPPGLSAAYVFVVWSGNDVQAVEVVISLQTAGGDHGPITGVKRIKLEDRLH